MRISLSSPVRKAAFLSGSVLVVLIFLTLACQTFAAYWITRTPTALAFERASRLEPFNAWHLRILGLYYLDRDHARAAQYFERALQINPHSAETWLELANVYNMLDQPGKQQHAVQQA